MMDTPPRQHKPKGQQRQKKPFSSAVHSDAQYHSDGPSARKSAARRQQQQQQQQQPQQQQYQHQIDGSVDYTASPQAPTPVKAYAGGTFHNSPAASALPMPRMFSKSVPSPAQASKLQSQLDAENRGPQPHSPAQQPVPQLQPLSREQSPLDVLFSAQRAEQARNTQNGSPLAKPPTAAAESPLLQRTPNHARPGPPNRAPSSREMFMMEMDGETDTDASDANARPKVSFKDRLSAVKSPNSAAAPHQHQPQDDESTRQRKTADLKKLLMMEQLNAKPPPNCQPGTAPHAQHYVSVQTGGQPPFNNRTNESDPFEYGMRQGQGQQRQQQQHQPQQQPPQQQHFHQQQRYPQHHQQRHHPQHHQQQQQQHGGPSAFPQGPGASDMQTLESNLRRVLKLDGMPGNPS